MKSRSIAIIPARGGSKRLHNKNILLLDGLPLLVHSIQYAQNNKAIIDEVYVSTDDEAIKEIALEYGAKVIDRPSEISGDLEPTITTLQHFLEKVEGVENVIVLQPTNPLRPENLLSECFDKFQKENAKSLFTVSRNHQKLGKIEDNRFVPFNYEIGQRSQDLEPLYFENGLLYICKSALILEGTIISDDAIPFAVDHVFGTLDIDTKEDFAFAEFLFKNKR